MMIQRTRHSAEVLNLLATNPVVAVLGPRQVGKTTLSRDIARRFRGGPVHFYDLEDPTDLARFADPMLALRYLNGLVVVDEIQRRADVFSTLRVLADRRPRRARFLVLGSASPDLLKQSAESLAGRISYHELEGFSLIEVGPRHWPRLWLRGGFPRSYLARTEAGSSQWRRDFVTTFLERDIPQLGTALPAATLRRFWTMLAHYHGQVWNSAAFASSFGVADTTVRRYLELLKGTFVARILPPWHENVGKRQVKSPKVYLADTGILHTLLGLPGRRDLEGHPKVGASWEGFAISQVAAHLGARPDECFFWATHAGAELDLLVVRGRRRLGFEFKYTVAPEVTKSMRIAVQDLGLARLDVIHAGDATFPLGPGVRAVALRRMAEDLDALS